MKKEHVRLTDQDREALKAMLRKGSLKSRTYKRITALLELDAGKTYEAVQHTVGFSKVSLGKLAKRYASKGLSCLYDAPRPGRPVEIQAEQRDQIMILACETPPEGYSQWSLRLLADKVVELGYCDSISHAQVDKILKKRKSNPT
ncbi:MAG: helix-turn-helix domain-containing protein [Lewinellaceae bacterium]|nr:helix-turn-helix domain-containing protein [Lewinellaceae bacterium]